MARDRSNDDTVAAANGSGDSLIGKEIIGQYVIRRRLGEGGMATVYLADQPSVGRAAVIKVLHTERSRRDLVERFRLEARAASRINHPNIVTIYNHGGTDDGLLFLAMEHVDGVSLGDLLGRSGALPLVRATSIARQIAGALAEAHRHGVVHRDLKPANVMIVRRGDTDDFVKVLDFGIAKVQGVDLTMTGLVCGTPAYMSPEQFAGDKVDGRSDLYSLGVLLFEMLAGALPFRAATPAEYMKRHLSDEPPLVSDVARRVRVPARLETLLVRTLAKNPSERPASAAAFVRELDEALLPEPTASASSATIPSAPSPALPARRAAKPGPAPAPKSTVPWPVRLGAGLRRHGSRSLEWLRELLERAWATIRPRRKRTLGTMATSLMQRLRRRRTWRDRVRDFGERAMRRFKRRR